MADQGELYEKSWILHHILDKFIGSRETVETRKRVRLMHEYFANISKRYITFNTGSLAEGMCMVGSDIDIMKIETNVIVMCPFQNSSISQDSKDKTVFMMRDADSRPGYVTLELVNLVPKFCEFINLSIVPVRDKRFISSGLYRLGVAYRCNAISQSTVETHGPAACMKLENNELTVDHDIVFSFPCSKWPREAYEWVIRPRPHGWPDKALRDQIVQGGCHLVPVGDRTSVDTFLQWRISFTTAERKLIFSLNHTQFLTYGLLKYFFRQISDRIKRIFRGDNIISSYIIKTVIFYATESTPGSLWQEKNTFFCFILCLKSLIAWVNAGHCPNYFINKNNMFLGKFHGKHQQKLLRILIELHDKKWGCLSVGTAIKPSLGIQLQFVRIGVWQWALRPPAESEMKRDILTISAAVLTFILSDSFSMSLSFLSKSKSDIDEFLGYITTVRALCCTGMDTFEKHVPVKGNKEKYKYLRKSKNLMAPLSSVSTSPGLLTLATYYYQTGNYPKALAICRDMISSSKLYFHEYMHLTCNRIRWYEHLYCERGFTLLHKCKEGCVSDVYFPKTVVQFCPSQLQLELSELSNKVVLSIPPLPYAVFLTFLCYHELGDNRRRDSALILLRAVKYDKEQGVSEFWIVHNLLGICYEMVGDTRSALGEYSESLNVRRHEHSAKNPAKKRIERLQNYQ